MTYDRFRTVKKGNKQETQVDRIRMFSRLIQIIKKKSQMIIALNPILTDQMNLKYVEYPEDIN